MCTFEDNLNDTKNMWLGKFVDYHGTIYEVIDVNDNLALILQDVGCIDYFTTAYPSQVTIFSKEEQDFLEPDICDE